MLTRILVPLDGSPLAEEALKYARQVVSPNGTIILLSVIQTPEHSFFPTAKNVSRIDQVLAQARTYLAKKADELRTGSLQVETQASMGEPARVIIETSRKAQVEAIVMSTHGHSGLARLFVGSVTLKVLSETACPVLVVPNKRK